MSQSEFSKKSREELIDICKERKIRGYSGKNKSEIISLLSMTSAISTGLDNANVNSPSQDTGIFRTNTKDQFYTRIDVAKKCIDTIIRMFPETVSGYRWIEPSAGNGSFLQNIPNTVDAIGIDLEPASPDISRADFLKWNPPVDKKVVLFGNPPFGRQSSLAKAFISKGCQFAELIAFILPLSFIKPSMSNAFDRSFHCMYSEPLERNAFMVNDTEYDVPCVFQIWQKKRELRELEQKVDAVGFRYVKSNDVFHIACRRVGALAGKCYKQGSTSFSSQSHYFIVFDHPMKSYIDAIIEKMNQHTFPSNTVGPRSLSKSEINVVMNEIVERVIR